MEQQIQRGLQALMDEQVTDAYLWPQADCYQLRVLIAGELITRQQFSVASAKRIMSYLKFRANMNISEHRRPQAGALHLVNHAGQGVDVRLSTVGNYAGQESLVVRFIYPVTNQFQVLVPAQWSQLQQLGHQTGVMLFAGPMGSGKTTTMYQLATLVGGNKTVMTIEDPVEITQPQFLQTQVNELSGMDDLTLLKVSLRHRPQILIIGEIRDARTAQLAIQAGLSGQLVLATIHARNARGVLSRLRQLGVSEYYLSQALLGINYQRLIPKTDGTWAVLFDQLVRSALQTAIDQSPPAVIGAEWTQWLAKLVKEGQLDAQVAQQFQTG